VACADPVAADAYATRFLGLKPEEVGMIRFSEKAGIGSADLSKIRMREAKA
jgi:hypothetical protein